MLKLGFHRHNGVHRRQGRAKSGKEWNHVPDDGFVGREIRHDNPASTRRVYVAAREFVNKRPTKGGQIVVHIKQPATGRSVSVAVFFRRCKHAKKPVARSMSDRRPIVRTKSVPLWCRTMLQRLRLLRRRGR